MTKTFGKEHALLYDAVYRDKDYSAECDIVESIIKNQGKAGPQRVLDLGCGTARHALELGSRGHTVVGVDGSPAMLQVARERLDSSDLAGSVSLVEGDIRTVRLSTRFDVVTILFNVIGYMLANDDVTRALQTARDHLDDGGLLIFDAWYGPTVLVQRPEERSKDFELNGEVLKRTSNASLDVRAQTCSVSISVEGSGEPVHEVHNVRYFFPLELELFLENARFRLVDLTSFPDVENPPSLQSWSVLAIAQAS